MKFTIKTIGCKVNTYESNKIKSDLIKSGFTYIDIDDTDALKDVDYYIINTCSVTSVADKKSRQMISKAKHTNEKVKVIAIGCFATSVILSKKDYDNENIFYLHNKDKMTVIDFIKNDVNDGEKDNVSNSNQEVKNKQRDPALIAKSSETSLTSEKCIVENVKVREFIKIQDGCDEYCTYCIIPYLRGHIKSRDDDEIIEEIKQKIKSGTKEIILTGIHISSFGVDREGLNYENDGALVVARNSLLTLMKKIIDVSIENGNKFFRLRLGSLEPRIIDEDFIKTLTKEPFKNIFCPNFCLSLQSGSDKTLKNMNRHYRTKDFQVAVETIRKYLKDATITADIIVGFPGETIDDFNESMEFVKKMRFYNPNIFPYSRRTGTKANDYDLQVEESEKHRRAKIMIAECEKITKEIENEYDRTHNTTIYDILVEEYIEKNGVKYAIGYTREYIKKSLAI